MTKEKKERLETIGDLITEHKSIGTQQELVELLRQKGFKVTQSSVSRDLQELGIKRVNGRYVLKPWRPVGAGDFEGIVGFIQLVERAGPHLTVITTSPNAARMVSEAIQDAHWPGVMGTVWSDDTIFLATAGDEDQRALFVRLSNYLKR
ncbi:MAG TPA: hypothetical protein VGG03_22180 [Thermoanaerobaculia bacterium]|jgi:transcriptional regulator of arginine metabolism